LGYDRCVALASLKECSGIGEGGAAMVVVWWVRQERCLGRFGRSEN